MGNGGTEGKELGSYLGKVLTFGNLGEQLTSLELEGCPCSGREAMCLIVAGSNQKAGDVLVWSELACRFDEGGGHAIGMGRQELLGVHGLGAIAAWANCVQRALVWCRDS